MSGDEHTIPTNGGGGEPDRLRKLAEMSMLLSGDPSDVFTKIAGILSELLDIPMVCISDIREHGPVVLHRYVDGNPVLSPAPCPEGPSPCRAAAQGRDMVLYENLATAFSDLSARQCRGAVSCCAVPAFDSSGKTVAAVCLLARQQKLFSDHDQSLIRVSAQRIAAEIEKQRYLKAHAKADEEREKLVDELKDALEKISHSRKEWQETFDNITDLISIHDRDFRIIRVNRAFAEHFGLEPSQILHKKCFFVFHGCNTEMHNCPHRRLLQDGKESTEEVHDSRSGKTFRVSTYPYYSGGEFVGSVHIARDITPEREKEMQFIMNERLASLGQMAAGLAHEINNPLASIAGCTGGLLNRLEKGNFEAERFGNYLRIIEEEIVRCKNITASMLSFVRKSHYEAKPVDIHALIDRTLEIIGVQGRLANVTVTKRYDEGSSVIMAGEGDLRQVLLSLLTNALDAMEEQGELSIETHVRDGRIRMSIGDTGPGIAPEHVESIFKPFFTTKAERGGTGLGLSIAQRIITQQNGEISLSSVQGEGAVFTITLPLP